jgi:hypothetical protein
VRALCRTSDDSNPIARGNKSIMSEQNVMDSPSEQFQGGDFENDFDGNDEGQPGPGMGQSKSSRRRRRKRKGKTGDEVGAAEGSTAAAPFVMEGESIAAAAAPAQQPQSPRRQQSQAAGQPQSAQPQGGQAQSGQAQQPGQGGKRWKKKFRDRERRPRNENPGNDFRADSSNSAGTANGGGSTSGYRADNFGNGGGGFKRKNKGGGGSNGGGPRRDRGFVGPMDHSYRESEGNSAGASTIQLHGSSRRSGHRHHGDSQPIDHSMPRAIPIPENAQTHIYFFIEELFFQAKIQESAKKLGVKVAFLKADNKESLAELTGGGDTNKPALIVFDLNNANAKPLTLIPKLKSKLKRSASIIGFLSHLQGDLKAKAVEAGCDTVMPRSAFSQNLPNLLRRYGVEEEEEINYNH